jgi:uncharacterized protein YdeI (YjbR/CyaY-like superfamily)
VKDKVGDKGLKHQPRFFKSPADFRAWLAAYHDRETVLRVGFYRKDSGKGGLSYRQALDEALCYGWIDGLVNGVDATSFMIRFTPRKADSTWSVVNTRRVKDLIKAGLMQPAGLKAFQARDPKKTRLYSFENRPRKLFPALEAKLRANIKAWEYFNGRPPGYRRTATWWVMSAKRAETRAKRLAILIAESAAGQLIPPLRRKPAPAAHPPPAE